MSFNVFVQNRFGVIRSYYFNDNNIKTVMDPTAGSVDYQLGKIILNQFSPFNIPDASKTIKIVAKPATNNFESSPPSAARISITRFILGLLNDRAL